MLLIVAALAASVLTYDGTLVVRSSAPVDDTTMMTRASAAPAPASGEQSSDAPPGAAHPLFAPNPGPWASARPIPAPQSAELRVTWVAAHVETPLWSGPNTDDVEVGTSRPWAPLQVMGAASQGRLPIWDPSERRGGWVQASDVGPIDPLLVGTAYLPPVGHRVAWSGAARITMYTCVELGGCAATASGLWPEPGMVAVDPAVIPLGSTVWVQGLGTFLAADTGSLVRGAHLDVYSLSYAEALDWGVQERAVFAFAPD
jgi:3D (Asp-Asp-Asp) domain-containing protein